MFRRSTGYIGSMFALLVAASPLYSVLTSAAPWYWVPSAFIVALSLFLMISLLGHALLRYTLMIFSALLLWLANAALAASYVMQDEGFNSAFFFHVRPDTLTANLSVYAPALVALCLQLIALIYFSLRSSKLVLSKRLLALSFTALSSALLVFAPLRSLADYMMVDQEALNQQANVLIDAAHESTELQPVSPAKNMVLIYAESLERGYFDERRFPGLLPELSQWRSESIDFTNVRQVEGTGWTAAGLVASQCGVPLISPYQSDDQNSLAPAERFLSQARCLTDLLAEQGYHNEIMIGSDQRFAGKQYFFTSHNFDQVADVQTLSERLVDPSYVHGWGLYDDALLGFVTERFDELAAAEQPFALQTITVDTHPPEGTLARDCQPYQDGENQMLNAIHCTDQHIDQLIEHIRQSPASKDTVVVVISDHEMMSGDTTEVLAQQPRRLTFFINEPTLKGSEHDQPATHFDMGPTILEKLGFEVSGGLHFGRSLLNQSGLLSSTGVPDDVLASEAVEAYVHALWGRPPSAVAGGIKVDDADSSLTIGSKPFNLRVAGWATMSSVWLSLDDALRLSDYQAFSNPRELAKAKLAQRLLDNPDQLQLAIAPARELAGFVSQSQPDARAIFIGKPNGAHYVSQYLDGPLHISPAQLRAMASAAPSTELLYKRRYADRPLMNLLAADYKSAALSGLSQPLSVSVCPFNQSNCVPVFAYGEQAAIALPRGLSVIAVQGEERQLVAQVDLCRDRNAFRRLPALSALLAEQSAQGASHVFLAVHDTLPCSAGAAYLSQWLEGTPFSHALGALDFRELALGVINLESADHYLQTGDVQPLTWQQDPENDS